MGGIAGLVRGAIKGRPYLNLLREAGSDEGVEIGVLPGDTGATERLRELLGLGGAVPSRGAGLLVHAATASADPAGAASALAAHRAAGGRALVLLVGTAAERTRLEERFLAHDGLGMGNLAHVASLDGAGAVAARRAVAEALGPALAATARRVPALREVATEIAIARAARRAATVGAVGVVPGAAMPVLTMLQARLVVELATIHDREIGMARAADLATVIAAGFGWRALGRGAVMLVPGPAFALRGGVAYAGTRAIGEAAARWMAEGDSGGGSLAGLRERIEGALRRGRGGHR